MLFFSLLLLVPLNFAHLRYIPYLPFLAPNSFKNATVFGIVSGCKSIVPVTFAPGASIESTNSAPTASVTDVKIIGISAVALLQLLVLMVLS